MLRKLYDIFEESKRTEDRFEEIKREYKDELDRLMYQSNQ